MSDEIRPVWITRDRAADAGLEILWDGAADGNRLAAFTDDELREISDCLDFTWANTTTNVASKPGPLADEIDDEIERRRTDG